MACPIQVYQELLDGQDEIVNWARERKNSGMFVDPSIAVQKEVRGVVSYVVRSYPDNQARRRFLRRAVSAHAIAQGGTVVTLESRVPPNSQKVKDTQCV